MWLTELDASCDEIQSKNAGVIQELGDGMPKYHFCAMKQKFVSFFLVECLMLNLLIYMKRIES